MPVLTDAQVQEYTKQSYLLVSGLMSEEIAAQAESAMWRLLQADPNDRSSWAGRSSSHQVSDSPALLACYTSQMLQAAAQLSGDAPETIKAPGRAYAINGFPTSEEWKWPRPHIDHAIKEHGHKTFPRAFRIAAMTFLSDVAPHGGGTIVWPGSHAVLERLAKSDPVRYETMWALNQDLATAPLTLASSDPVQVYELLRGQSRRGHRRAQGTQDPEAKGKGKGF